MRRDSGRLLQLSPVALALPAGTGGWQLAAAQAGDEESIEAVLVDMGDALGQGDPERHVDHLHPDITSNGETDPLRPA